MADTSARRDPFRRKVLAITDKVGSERFSGDDADATSIIYHYTDRKGLIGIVSSGELWATDVRYLNDSSELVHAEKIHDQLMGEIAGEYPGNSAGHRLAEAARRRRSWLNEALDTYVACFSAKDNLLTQWNTYGSRGSGFSIGFDRRKLEAAIRPPQPKQLGDWLKAVIRPDVHVGKVRYSEEEQKRELRRVFDLYLAPLSDQSPQGHVDRCADSIVNNVARSASLFKHPCFESEAEWRIIISTLGGASDLSFRDSRRTVIPFMRTLRPPDGTLPIVSIMIGPTLHATLSKRSVEALLRTKGYDGVEIRASDLPLTLTD